MSQGALAERLGICASYMSEIETGRKFASFKTLYKLSQIFDCELQELLDDQTDRRRKRLEAEDVIECTETKSPAKLQEESSRRNKVMLLDIIEVLQTLDITSLKKVFIYVNDMKTIETSL